MDHQNIPWTHLLKLWIQIIRDVCVILFVLSFIPYIIPYNTTLDNTNCKAVYHGERYKTSKNPRKPEYEKYSEVREGHLIQKDKEIECHFGAIQDVFQ